MNKPHKHAEVIKAWADNPKATVQWQRDTDAWIDCKQPFCWDAYNEYRIKPEKVYPETQMTTLELEDSYRETSIYNVITPNRDGFTAIANAALRHAIDSGQVVNADHEIVVMARETRAARDMAIAIAVRLACVNAATEAPNLPTFCNMVNRRDLITIIATVK